jgi:hypothetical protein
VAANLNEAGLLTRIMKHVGAITVRTYLLGVLAEKNVTEKREINPNDFENIKNCFK